MDVPEIWAGSGESIEGGREDVPEMWADVGERIGYGCRKDVPSLS